MASATTKPARSVGGRHADGHGFGLVMFAGIVLAWLGVFNLMYGAVALAGSHVLTTNAHLVFGTLHWWGWVTLIIGAVQVLAAAAVLLGSQLARWFGVAVVGLSAIAQMFLIPAYPWWSLVIIAVDIVALYGLCAYDGAATANAFWADLDPGALGQKANTNQGPRPGSAGGHRATV